jgi:hypothetical protein
MAQTAQSLVNSATSLGYDALSYRDTLECILYNAQAGGGGGAGGGFTQGNYSGGAPSFTPTSAPAWAIDTSNGLLWVYFNSAWASTGLTV